MASTSTWVGDALLSSHIRTMMDKLTSTEFLDHVNNRKLNLSVLMQLQTTLLALGSMLDDAEMKQIRLPVVRQWLNELKDAIYDAQDLLNQISDDSIRFKVTTEVPRFLSSLFNTNEEINSQIKNACERLQLFPQRGEILGLETASPVVFRRVPTTSSAHHSVIVVGRKDDKEKLIKILLSDTENNNIGVVTILGTGGIGKTTLARLLYNDKEVRDHFDLIAWVGMSELVGVVHVTKALLKAVTSRNWDTNDLLALQVELKQNLRDKRFLIVFDDDRNDNYCYYWDELMAPFVDKSGSKVIITTRQQIVAEAAHAFHIHKLEPLAVEDTWSLLSKHAFGSKNFHDVEFPILEAIGQRIARKCGGLPLAAEVLGGLLRSNVDAEHWNEILNKEMWKLPNSDVLPALYLSYLYLPSCLKKCFAYCSIFPKHYSLDRSFLIRLWMAEGLIEPSLGSREPEIIGAELFDELISRSLIQQSNYDTDGKKFVMHDLISDLATFATGTSLSRLQYEGNIPVVTLWGQIRFCRLRVLSLSGSRNVKRLPDSLGNLTQLRYLNLSITRIKSLPNTTCNLYNLQTLILSYCYRLTHLPIDIGGLVNLRHLDISGTSIKEMPMQIVELEELRTLTVFIVGKDQVGLSIKELGKFPRLRGKLTILNLHNVINSVEAFAANLKSKDQIEDLVLQWGEQTEDHRTDKNVLDVLQPSINLNKLSIGYYGGKSFPSWLGDSSFSNMVYLSIRNCEYCHTLPPLGQLSSLKDLMLDGMRMLKTIGPEFYGMVGEGSNSSFQPFPTLQNLQFRNMSSWKEWLPFEGGKFPFPCLQTLRLQKCPKLRGHLPGHLPSIEQIIIIDCGRLLETPSTLQWLSYIENKNILYLK